MIEYDIIKSLYGDKRAKRSGLPYMRHIDQGLFLLDKIHGVGLTFVSDAVRRAWAIHPVFQLNELLIPQLRAEMDERLNALGPRVIILAMEYRSIANSYLTSDVYLGDSRLKERLWPLPCTMADVNLMLTVDKVQNYRDARRYLFKHINPREQEKLDFYFRRWFTALNMEKGYVSRLEAWMEQYDEEREMSHVVHIRDDS